MANRKVTRGNNAQFTYDFGIAIAQSTINRVTRLTGASLTLASAFYALKTTSKQYLDILRENTLRFGGVLSTMKAMEQAQERLIKGQSYFSVDDQLRGMNKLMSVGIKVGENLDWINKAAHATGRSYAEFSNIIASAIQGNSQALVDAGLITQRATRMFDKYAANTIMRQQAILNFVKSHKGLMNAIKNDFETVQDQITRIRETWRGFLQSILGKPNDPNSFYGQVTSSLRMVATAMARNFESIRKYGWVIGQTLGWVMKQIGHFVVWIGSQSKKAVESVWRITDNYVEQTRSMLVWLEFWKLKIVDFFKEYGGAIKSVLKLLIMYKALKTAFVIGEVAIKSVKAYRAALLGTWVLQKRYMDSMGPFIGKTGKFFQSLAVWLPRPFRKAWIYMGKFFSDFRINMLIIKKGIIGFFTSTFGWLVAGSKLIFSIIKNIPAIIAASLKALKMLWVSLNATNPIGWILLAITLITTLYTKSKTFRTLINNLFRVIIESLKLVWNSLAYVITYALVGLKKVGIWFNSNVWEPVSGFFKDAFGWIDSMWKKFMNTAVGKWINDWIVEPLRSAFEFILNAWNKLISGLSSIVKWISGTNTSLAEATEELAKKNGIYSVPTIKGGDYSGNLGVNYLNPDNWGNNDTTDTPKNPLIKEPVKQVSNETNMASSMNFNNGAIQIIVQKGENIDEAELARKIREVINDISRNNSMRGGTV